MDSQKDKIDLAKVFRTNGYLLPLSEDEVEAFETNMIIFEDLPVDWENPINILHRGKRQSTKLTNPQTDQNAINHLAMAARDGNTISDAVRKQMNYDRKNSNNK